MSQSPYKIGIDARCLEGNRTGTGRYLLNLLKHFPSTGSGQAVQPDFAFYLYFKHEIPSDAYFQEQSFKLRRLGLPFGIESNAVFTHISLPAALKEDGVDILFAPSYVAPWNCPVPLALTLHDISYEAHPEWTPWQDQFLLRVISWHAARRAVHILTISEFSKKEIMRLYHVPEKRIAVVPLAADTELSQPASEAEDKTILDKFGITGDFIFSVGNLINRRYPLQTLDAFAEVVKKNTRHPNPKIPGVLQLVLVGPDRTHPPLGVRAKIDSLNNTLSRLAVVHLPNIPDKELSVLYRKAKALVWLSAYEGFGLPLLEAMAQGTPVITSHTSSLPEVVSDAAILLGEPRGTASSTTGISENPGPRVGTIADAMLRILADETLRTWLIVKGKTQSRKFSWKITAEATLAVFRKILSD